MLVPVVAYFMLFGGRAHAASRDYLRRVTGRQPSLHEVYRHFYAFAAVALDRVYFLSDRWSQFDVRSHGEELLREKIEKHNGCILLGAHLGSFECLRMLARRQKLGIKRVVFEQNTRNIANIARAINPEIEQETISLGEPDSMLRVVEHLDSGKSIGMLADRALSDHGLVEVPFLGGVASFPTAPFRLSAIAGRPVILMIGLYRGGNRYDVYFETLVESPTFSGAKRDQIIERWVRLYADRVAYYCRQAPYNWFNFFAFWTNDGDPDKV